MKNYAILGISYCGSTLLSLLLGKAEKVFSVGEAHWLLQGQPQCRICTKDCSFYSKDFLNGLNWNNLTGRIARRARDKYGCDIVLYSDKNEKFYRQLFNHDKPDAFILLFKNPKGFVSSYLRHNPTDNPKRRKKYIKEAIRQYEIGYLLNLKYIEECNSGFIGIYYDDFILNLPKKMKDICSFLDIKYSTKLTNLKNLPDKIHQIGGNFRVNSDFLKKSIRLDDNWKKILTEGEARIIDSSIASEIFTRKLYPKSKLN
jgi:hypothetical protein